ncbi:MAG: elongation factor 1-beta [Candidatus Woesearchaeota archaeon]
MAQVVITLKIMPTSPEVDLSSIIDEVSRMIIEFAGETDIKTEEEPIAFGLKALIVMFVSDEAKGATEDLEAEISGIEGVQSIEVTDVRRAIG